LFNNQWNTNFRSFWSGDLTARVRLWAIDQYDNQRDLTTPVANTLSPLLAGLSNYTAGTLPVSARGVSLSRPGVLLTAFGPNPDGDGTLLRIWEDAGQSGSLTVTLTEGFQVDRVQPIDLRGRPLGEVIAVTNGKFTCRLGKYEPKSFLISAPWGGEGIAPTKFQCSPGNSSF
jgi:alpha-mannosidase